MTDQLAADGVDEDHTVDAPEHDAAVLEPSTKVADDDVASGRFGIRPKRQRVTRWDRPPEPHDWRFYVGTVGKVMITMGLLMFGFVAYQLWGTGIETARAQNKLENEFESLLVEFADGEIVAAPPEGAATDDEPDALDPALRTPGADAADAEPIEEPAVVAERRPANADPEVVVPVAVDLSDQAVVQDPIPQPFRGDPLLRLEIPKIGRDDIVVPGVALNDLKDGPGHYPDTPLPGQLGNASIAGHRTTYGAPFFDVDQLSAGDEIITTLLNGDRFVYEVTFIEVVAASDYWVVTTSNPDIAELTLTSCHPKYTARDRIVVHSVLNTDKSSNVGLPTFYSLEPDPEDAPIPGDDPVLVADIADVAADTGDIEVTEPDSALEELDARPADDALEAVPEADPAPGSSDPSGNVPGPAQPAGGPTALDEPAPIDAFSEGWFHDANAFPHILLWGLALAMISVLGYRVSKRFRRYSVGIALGVMPFLVALYFFYQNVNRLLPPGI